MENPTIRFLQAVFEKGEFLGVAREVKSDDGSARPDKDDATFDREWWLGKLKKNKGDINKMLASSKKTGAYIRINPMKENGKADKDVTSYRHVLLEFDTISLKEQYSRYLKSGLPITEGSAEGKAFEIDRKTLNQLKAAGNTGEGVRRVKVDGDSSERFRPRSARSLGFRTVRTTTKPVESTAPWTNHLSEDQRISAGSRIGVVGLNEKIPNSRSDHTR